MMLIKQSLFLFFLVVSPTFSAPCKQCNSSFDSVTKEVKLDHPISNLSKTTEPGAAEFPVLRDSVTDNAIPDRKFLNSVNSGTPLLTDYDNVTLDHYTNMKTINQIIPGSDDKKVGLTIDAESDYISQMKVHDRFDQYQADVILKSPKVPISNNGIVGETQVDNPLNFSVHVKEDLFTDNDSQFAPMFIDSAVITQKDLKSSDHSVEALNPDLNSFEKPESPFKISEDKPNELTLDESVVGLGNSARPLDGIDKKKRSLYDKMITLCDVVLKEMLSRLKNNLEKDVSDDSIPVEHIEISNESHPLKDVQLGKSNVSFLSTTSDQPKTNSNDIAVQSSVEKKVEIPDSDTLNKSIDDIKANSTDVVDDIKANSTVSVDDIKANSTDGVNASTDKKSKKSNNNKKSKKDKKSKKNKKSENIREDLEFLINLDGKERLEAEFKIFDKYFHNKYSEFSRVENYTGCDFGCMFLRALEFFEKLNGKNERYRLGLQTNFTFTTIANQMKRLLYQDFQTFLDYGNFALKYAELAESVKRAEMMKLTNKIDNYFYPEGRLNFIPPNIVKDLFGFSDIGIKEDPSKSEEIDSVIAHVASDFNLEVLNNESDNSRTIIDGPYVPSQLEFRSKVIPNDLDNFRTTHEYVYFEDKVLHDIDPKSLNQNIDYNTPQQNINNKLTNDMLSSHENEQLKHPLLSPQLLSLKAKSSDVINNNSDESNSTHIGRPCSDISSWKVELVSVDFPACTREPCNLQRGLENSFRLKLKALKQLNGIKVGGSTKVGFINFPMKISDPFPCKSGALNCPIPKGAIFEVPISVFIRKLTPTILVKPNLKLYDEKNREIMCAQIQVKVV